MVLSALPNVHIGFARKIRIFLEKKTRKHLPGHAIRTTDGLFTFSLLYKFRMPHLPYLCAVNDSSSGLRASRRRVEKQRAKTNDVHRHGWKRKRRQKQIPFDTTYHTSSKYSLHVPTCIWIDAFVDIIRVPSKPRFALCIRALLFALNQPTNGFAAFVILLQVCVMKLEEDDRSLDGPRILQIKLFDMTTLTNVSSRQDNLSGQTALVTSTLKA